MKAVKLLIDWPIALTENNSNLKITPCAQKPTVIERHLLHPWLKVKVYWINQSQKHIFCGPEFI